MVGPSSSNQMIQGGESEVHLLKFWSACWKIFGYFLFFVIHLFYFEWYNEDICVILGDGSILTVFYVGLTCTCGVDSCHIAFLLNLFLPYRLFVFPSYLHLLSQTGLINWPTFLCIKSECWYGNQTRNHCTENPNSCRFNHF